MNRANHKAAPRRAEHLDEDTALRRIQCNIPVGTQSLAHCPDGSLVELEVALELTAMQEKLRARFQLRRQRNRTPLGVGGDHRLDVPALHSTRSTKISILPPQARPTSQACSSLTPKSRRRGLPSWIAAWASSITAPSTQPPETDPTKAPSSATASLAPAGRGDEPQVLTTVASATPLPAWRQLAACSRISA